MKRAAILYVTKTGAVETYAQRIEALLGGCDTFDISTQQVDLQNYDKIILGCGLRIGKAYKQMRSYMKKNADVLAEKQLWIYFCGVDEEGFAKVPEANVPGELQESAKNIALLKGRQPFDKTSEVQTWIDEEALKRFAWSIAAA